MRRYRYVLLAIPFLALIFPPLYNHVEPQLFGMPFFYWYQLMWIVLTGTICGIVVLIGRENGADV